MSESQGVGDHACQCLCHQVFLPEQGGVPPLTARVAEAGVVFVEGAAVPPEVVPLGIDHPPQLVS